MHRIVTAVALTLVMVGCGNDQPAPIKDQQVSGEVVYRERILTPPGSQLTVQVSDADGNLLGEQQQEVQGGPPFPYQVDYAQADSVTISASLYFDGKLRFEFVPQPIAVAASPLLLRGAQ
ncbi:YbaY family lipoprotein [Ferrimonas lipolytica]|uniref:Lipoprotein n=1 Tax=Ferrimonas lipolytica TaxID=2724191 RepID=A0A6H1UG98_9GAMM|nr:YbaY family lipoprotein [Ferrimonas lipolytica]QIZ78127.1 hypothetical protein HER31_15190 [Ferrimonas lipolytica]